MTTPATITHRRDLLHGARGARALAGDYFTRARASDDPEAAAAFYASAASAYRLARGLYIAAGAGGPADVVALAADASEWRAAHATREVLHPTT